MNKPWSAILSFSAFAILTSGAAAQSELQGRVVSDSGVPIPGATVTLAGLGYSVRSDSAGRFRLSGTPGSTLNLTLRAGGFRDDSASVVLTRGKAVVRDFVLFSEATAPPETNPSADVVRGLVVSVEGDPIAYANVQLNGGMRFVTDDSGRFTIPVNTTGGFSLLVRRIGFGAEEVKFAEKPDTAVRIQMKAVARALPTALVTGKSPFVNLDLGGFYRRMSDVRNRAQVGYFVTPEELELRGNPHVTRAIEQVPGVRIRPIPGAGSTSILTLRIENLQGCPMTVFLDRVRIQPLPNGGNEQVNTLVTQTSMAGIEIYPRSAGAPMEYQGQSGSCGIVLIWTK